MLTQEARSYHSIRIDSVHYCDREIELAAKRKRRSHSGRNGSAPQERLQLLSKTVRENGQLAQKVEYLKIPYMVREGSLTDLARTISFMPNLRYVDLPDALYTDDPSCGMLKQELQARCPGLCQMRYLHGSESSFQTLAQSRRWRNLEALELSHLAVEPTTIIDVFTALTALREVKMADMPMLDDSLFDSTTPGISFPPLAIFSLQATPNISATGLVTYLSQPLARKTLNHLLLTDTGVLASDLHRILSTASNLTSLDITMSVTRPLSLSQLPPLASPSLRTFHYEISSATLSPGGLASPSDSYYAYLSTSVLSGSLPSLSHLYVLSDSPQTLLQPAPCPPHKGSRTGARPPPLSLGITRPLHLYTKSVREMEWDVTLISPPSSAHRRGSITAAEPESLRHHPPLSPLYRNKDRDSVIVGNGFGGFLAVPTLDSAPGSPQWKNKKKDMDAWMG